ncbi:MAG: biopolymer transporter ExbD [Luteolibacter sp.]|jgi:biopolymer transport protein ExbD|nr:biopolymer transporter ExbD [Luteolibacter sp.]
MPVQLQSRSGDDAGDEARIEVIPLIDIMFFLLAAFMLVSLSMTHLQRVPVNLPTASTGLPDARTPPFQIAIDASGVTTWDSKVVTLTEITARLQAAAVPRETRVLISADEQSRHKQVLAVLNAVRDAGVEKVSFETKD